MEAMNPDVRVNTYHTWISADNILDIIDGYNFVIDGTDNFAAKFLINDACVLAGKPYSHGGDTPFRRPDADLHPRPIGLLPLHLPRSAAEERHPHLLAGGSPRCASWRPIGMMQATEALKYLLGIGELLAGRLLVYDALAMTFRTVKVRRNPHCPICGENPAITELKDELDAMNVCDLEKK
jgi:molybdopterin-synthase adenylyltransferase